MIVKFIPDTSTIFKAILFINGVKQKEKIGRGEAVEFHIEKDSQVYATMAGMKTSTALVYAHTDNELTINYNKGAWKVLFDFSEIITG